MSKFIELVDNIIALAFASIVVNVAVGMSVGTTVGIIWALRSLFK